MIEQELRAWGKSEHEARLYDMACFRAGAVSLAATQRAAELRRIRDGLSQADSDRALRLARVSRSA